MSGEGMKVPEGHETVERLAKACEVFVRQWRGGHPPGHDAVIELHRAFKKATPALTRPAIDAVDVQGHLAQLASSRYERILELEREKIDAGAVTSAERDRMREALEIGLDAVSDAKGWGTYNRMEGCDLYGDVSKFKDAARAALSEAPTPAQPEGEIKPMDGGRDEL